MELIGENIHIISKNVKEAYLSKNEKYFTNLIEIQKNMDFIDLNVGPAKGLFSGIIPYLINIVKKTNPKIGISLDTTNIDEMKTGLEELNNSDNIFINSTPSDSEKFDILTELAINKNCNLIALTMSKETGIPKFCDGRLEIACDMYERFIEKGIDTEKVYFDPLVLPITADQSQAGEAINTIKMIKESFEKGIKTVVGLSNVSNGCPNDIRPLINRVFAVMAVGAGLDAAIIDAKDEELCRILRMLEKRNSEKEIDNLYLKLCSMTENFEELENVEYNKSNEEECKIIKTAKIILNKEVYSDSFTQI